MRVDGTPTFALTDVAVTPEEAENGVHYYLADLRLQALGFEEPYVHFFCGVDIYVVPGAFLLKSLHCRRHPSDFFRCHGPLSSDGTDRDVMRISVASPP